MDFKIIQHQYGKGLQSNRSFAAGEHVIELAGIWVQQPSTYTIQMGDSRHLEPSDHLWALINHSCAPNLQVSCEGMEMRALRHILAGEELFFDYLTTEWDMATPFACQCNSDQCKQTISGARYLGANQQTTPKSHGIASKVALHKQPSIHK